MHISTKPPEFPEAVWEHVQTLLANQALAETLGDCTRIGRLDALEEMTATDPSIHLGQMAFIRVGWHLRRALAALGWTRKFIENQEVFTLAGHGIVPEVSLIYFTGQISDDQQAVESTPRGKRTKIGIRSNRLQYEFDFGDDAGTSGNVETPGLWLFLVSKWNVEFLDGNWTGRIRAWLAFCDGALTRTGGSHPIGEDSKFSKMRCLDYREILDHRFGGEIHIPGPAPVKSSPTVMEIVDEGGL